MMITTENWAYDLSPHFLCMKGAGTVIVASVSPARCPAGVLPFRHLANEKKSQAAWGRG